jgi:hypothetical protein
MIVLTVKTLEAVAPEIQREIHSILRMEFQTDYVFKDLENSQYSATISIDDANSTVKTIIKNSAKIPEYTLEIDELDMANNTVERIKVRNAIILERKSGSLEWEE